MDGVKSKGFQRVSVERWFMLEQNIFYKYLPIIGMSPLMIILIPERCESLVTELAHEAVTWWTNVRWGVSLHVSYWCFKAFGITHLKGFISFGFLEDLTSTVNFLLNLFSIVTFLIWKNLWDGFSLAFLVQDPSLLLFLVDFRLKNLFLVEKLRYLVESTPKYVFSCLRSQSLWKLTQWSYLSYLLMELLTHHHIGIWQIVIESADKVHCSVVLSWFQIVCLIVHLYNLWLCLVKFILYL